MYYYAMLNPSNDMCIDIVQYQEQQTDPYAIAIESYDASLIYNKRYNRINQTWEDMPANESGAVDTRKLTHGVVSGKNLWLEEFLGFPENLETTDKTSLVNAINECFQSASDGKTAISGAITAKASGVTIPTNPTFAQLAAAIGQIPTMQVATGNLNVYTAPGGAISGNTTFRPRIVFFKNNQSGATNSNYGIYIDCEYFNFVKGATDPQALSVNYNEWGYNGGGSANDVFAITDTGWSANTGGLATNLCWIAIG